MISSKDFNEVLYLIYGIYATSCGTVFKNRSLEVGFYEGHLSEIGTLIDLLANVVEAHDLAPLR